MRDLVQRADYQCKQDKTYHHTGIAKIQEFVKSKLARKFTGDRENSTSADQKKSDERHARRLLAVATATGLFEAKPLMTLALERNLMEKRARNVVEEAEREIATAEAEEAR